MSFTKSKCSVATTLAILIIGSSTMEKTFASLCKWHKEGSISYCLIPRDWGSGKTIEVVLTSSRENSKVMIYRGNSFAKESIFIDDEYSGKHILKYFGADKVILQDKNGNPPSVYLR